MVPWKGPPARLSSNESEDMAGTAAVSEKVRPFVGVIKGCAWLV